MQVGPYELDNVYQGDCLELMKQLPDKSIDLVLTDPPYGIGESMKNHKSRGKYAFGGKSTTKQLAKGKDYGYSEWDKSPPPIEYFNELFRVSKNQVIFGGNYFNLPPSSCWIVWDKDNGDNDFADCELAWTSFKSAIRKFKWRKMGMLQEDMKNKEVWQHPTQKPLPLFRWILEKYTGSCDIVLDPFLGSGTTAVAAKQLNRRFLGFEINPVYVAIAEKRLNQEVLSQWTLTN